MKYKIIKRGGWDRHPGTFPVVGKIGLGIRDPNRMYPREQDYFVIKEPWRKRFAEIFGPECTACMGAGCEDCEGIGKTDKIKKMRICFVSQHLEDNAPSSYEHWRGSGKRCEGDGEECTRTLITCSKCNYEFIGENWQFRWDGQTNSWKHNKIDPRQACPECRHAGKSRPRVTLDCLNTECEAYKKGFCKMICRIRFMVPEVTISGVFQVTTASKNVMFHRIPQDLEHIKRVTNGRLAFLMDPEPFDDCDHRMPIITMWREPVVTYQEHKSTHYLIRFSIGSRYNSRVLEKYSEQLLMADETTVPRMALPEPEEEIPDELFPIDIVEEVQAFGYESQSDEDPQIIDESVGFVKPVVIDQSDDGGQPCGRDHSATHEDSLVRDKSKDGEEPRRRDESEVTVDPRTTEFPYEAHLEITYVFRGKPGIIKPLIEAGYRDVREVPLDIEKLQELPFIGETRAKGIIETIQAILNSSEAVISQPSPIRQNMSEQSTQEKIKQLLMERNYDSKSMEALMEIAKDNETAARNILTNLKDRQSAWDEDPNFIDDTAKAIEVDDFDVF